MEMKARTTERWLWWFVVDDFCWCMVVILVIKTYDVVKISLIVKLMTQFLNALQDHGDFQHLLLSPWGSSLALCKLGADLLSAPLPGVELQWSANQVTARGLQALPGHKGARGWRPLQTPEASQLLKISGARMGCHWDGKSGLERFGVYVFFCASTRIELKYT